MQSKIPVAIGVLLFCLGIPLLLLLFSSPDGSGKGEGIFGGPFFPAMDADKLRQGFSQRPTEYEKLLRGKGVDIIGMSLGSQKVTYDGVTYEAIRMGDNGTVLCAFPGSTKEQVKSVRPGDPVRIQGQCRGLQGSTIVLTGCRLVPLDED